MPKIEDFEPGGLSNYGQNIEPGNKRNPISAGISSGLDDLQGLGYSAIAAGANAVGAKGVQDWANNRADINEYEAAINGRSDLERIEDQSLGSALPYVGYQVAKQIPNLIGAVAAGAVVPEVAVPTALSRGAALLPRALGGGGMGGRVAAAGTEAGAQFAAKRAALEGGQAFGKQVVGGMAFNEGQAIGSLYQAARDGGDEDAGLRAIAGSPVYALTETLPEAMLVGRFKGGSGFGGNLLSRAGKSAGIQAAAGATSEGLQNEMEIAYNGNMSDAEKASARLNSIAAGGLVEGVFGAFGGGKGRTRTRSTAADSILSGGNDNQLSIAVNQGNNAQTETQVVLANQAAQARQQQADADEAEAQLQQAAVLAKQQADAEAAAKQKVIDDGRAQTMSAFGMGDPADQTKGNLFGQPLFGPNVKATTDAVAEAAGKLNPVQQELTKAVAVANSETGNRLVKFKFNATNVPQSVGKAFESVGKVLTEFQIAHVESTEEAAKILDAQSNTIKGEKLEQLNAIHQALTGKDTSGYLASQQSGDKNGKLQLQKQTNAGVGAVSTSGKPTNALLQSGSVQSVGTGSKPAGQDSKQNVGTGEKGTQTVQSGTATNGNANAGNQQTQAQVTKEQEEWEAMDGTNTSYESLPEPIKKAWAKAVKSGKVTGQVQEELAALAKRENNAANAGNIVTEVLATAIPRASKRSVEDHQKFLDYVARTFGGQKQSEKDEKAQMQLKGNERRVGGWNRQVKTLIAEKGDKLRSAAEQVAAKYGMTTEEVLKMLDDSLTKSEEIHNETNQTAVDQRDLMKNEDGSSKGMGKSQQTYKEAKAKKEKKEKQQSEAPPVTKIDPAEYMNSEEYKKNTEAAAKKAKLSDADAKQEQIEKDIWDNHAKQFGLPEYDALPPGAKADWMAAVANGKTNLAKVNAILEANGLVDNGDPQFSKAKGTVKNAWYSDGLKESLKRIFNSNRNFDALVTVVDSFSELPTYVQNALKGKNAEKAQGFVYGKRVYMLAENIEMGNELAVFLHEVGAHLGMENLLGPENYNKLYKQIETWAKGKDTTEAKIAKKAKERVESAKVADEDYMDELIAYFVEEAVASGIQPMAIAKEQSAIGKWFRDLVAGLKIALRKIGLNKFQNLSAGNIVDLAFGAAKLELNGTYHGSAAEFKKFMTKHIGTGEGAVAFGWGLYMAERFGTAFDYMKSDIKRKSDAAGLSYKGQSFRTLRRNEMFNLGKDIENRVALDILRQYKTLSKTFGVPAPIKDVIKYEIEQWQKRIDNKETGTLSGVNQRYVDALKALNPDDFGAPVDASGQLYRTMPMVGEEQLVDLDTPLRKQPEILKLLEDKLSEAEKEALVEETNLDLDEMTGRDLQDALMFTENKGLTDLFSALPDEVIDTIKPGPFMSKQIVSEFLRMLGIQGNTYLDRGSRSTNGQLSIKRIPTLQKAIDDLGGTINVIDPNDGKRKEVRPTRAYVATASTGQKNVFLVTPAGNYSATQVGISKEAQKDILENMEDAYTTTRNLVLFSDDAIKRIATYESAKKDRVKFSFAAVDKAKEMANKNISEMPKAIQGPVRAIISGLFNAKEALLQVLITEDVAELAKKVMPNNQRWQQAMDRYIATQHERNFIVNTHEEALAKVMVKFNSLNQHEKNAVNKLIEESTLNEKWAYDPKIDGVTVDQALSQKFKALPATAQEVVKFVFDYGRVTLAEKQATIRAIVDETYKDKPNDPKKAELLRSFGTILRLNPTSPYAPLKRFGAFVVVGKSQAYIDAEKNKDNKEIEKLRSQGNHYIVSFVDTAGQARQLYQDLAATGNYTGRLDAFKKSEIKDKLFSGTDLWKGFEKLKRVIAAEKGVGGSEIAGQLQKLVDELYLISLADSSARKSELQRKKIYGYDGDMMRSFFVQGMADAHYIANMKTSRKSLDAMIELQEEAGQSPEKANPYLNEIMAREAQSLESRPASWLDMANRMTAHWFLTFSPSFYLQQLTQTYTLSLPWLAGEYNYFKSERALRAAYKDVLPLVKDTNLKEHLDFSKLPADVRDMLKILVGRGRINIGIEAEISNHRSTSDNKALEAFNNATDFLRGGINRIEAINRATAAIAAYRLEMAKSGNKEKAIAAADKVVHVTHGSYDGFNTPRFFGKSAVTRSITQFRRFQVIQLSMLARMAHGWAKGATPTEKAIARKQFLFLMGHMFSLAGAKGLPMWGLASLVYTLAKMAFGDDDDPEDLEEVLRNSGGIMLAKGIPAWLGVDVSDKLGMGKVTSLLPYTDVDLLTRKGIAETALGVMGPFIGGVLPKMADGVNYLLHGDYYKGLESMLPNGFNNAAKAIRFATEGITQRNGDLVMSPDEMGFFDITAQALGLPTTKMTERQYLQGLVKKYDDFYDQKISEIKRDYVQAYRNNDQAAAADAREQWATLQESRVKHGYKRQPLSELIKAPMQARKREQGVIAGVETSKANRRFVRRQVEGSD